MEVGEGLGMGLKHHAGQLMGTSSLLVAPVTWPSGPPPQAKEELGGDSMDPDDNKTSPGL